MFKTPTMRLTIALVLFAVNIIILADVMGFIPDVTETELKLRKNLSESLALQFSAEAGKGDYLTIKKTLTSVVERNENILSAAIRTNDEKIVAVAGKHIENWKLPDDGKSTPTYVNIPIFFDNKKWGTVEIRFTPIWKKNLLINFSNSLPGLLAFVALGSFISYFFIIKKTLRELDPSAVIPERVQKAYDVLQEGALVLDEKEHIVMANKCFAGLLGKTPENIVGLKGSELGWINYSLPDQISELPWIKALNDETEQKGVQLSLMNEKGKEIKLSANAAMITDNRGKCRGIIATFDDITQLEEKNYKLSKMVEELQASQNEIKAKNNELKFMANHDPLTFCLNRRAMGKKLRELFKTAMSDGSNLSCIMADIDFFKSVNDTYGHAAGDQVIKGVADILKTSTRDGDLVGRYGGEEFCVVLPELDIEIAYRVAERIRAKVESSTFADVHVTLSLGVSSLSQNPNNPSELVNNADKALYMAKKLNRNQVVIWEKDMDTIDENDKAEARG